MASTAADRLGPITGIAFVVLTFIGMNMVGGNQPNVDAPADTIHAFFETNHENILTGLILVWVGSATLLFFVAWLAAQLRTGDPAGWLHGAAFAGGITFVGSLLALTALPYAAANRFQWDEVLDPATAQTIHVLQWDALTIAWFPMGVLIGATALSALATRWMPRWLAWTGIVLAIGLLTYFVAWFVFLLVLVWLLVVCVLALLGKTGATANV